ncbi:hypothetical protein VNO77_02959 [Canavalia gladiata]|uniref:Uncharacterized protein n=1 Tax=Canavalia gladiata TaxID=3824 RepID=A0AAN9MTX0_CANGL
MTEIVVILEIFVSHAAVQNCCLSYFLIFIFPHSLSSGTIMPQPFLLGKNYIIFLLCIDDDFEPSRLNIVAESSIHSF